MNSNGPLTGIAHYRGMFGSRLHLAVDNIPITSAGPSAMDPPLSYAPRLQLETIEVYRGIAPVSSGIETFGGTIVANAKTADFTEDDKLEFHGEVNSDLNSNNNGVSYGSIVSLANKSHKIYMSGTREDGDDFEFDGGTIRSMVHERKNLKLGGGLRYEEYEIGIDYNRVETEKSGTPALPMDIMFFDGDIWGGEYKLSWWNVGISGKVYYTDIEHGMSNSRLRPAPPDVNKRSVFAESKAIGYTMKATVEVGEGYVNLGTDGDLAENNADIMNPTFLVQNFNDAERDRYGLFAEWTNPFVDQWEYEVGVRYNRIETNADNVNTSIPLPSVQALRDRFNSSDRSQNDNNIDTVVKLRYQINPELRLELGGARKTRSPSFQERYLWLPLESTAGLSKGNRYVGDPRPDPEESYEVDFGFDLTREIAYLRPHIFYRSVDDYIQGTPATDPTVIMVSTNNGDPTPLQLSNVDAEFYGFDVDGGVSFLDYWKVESTLSFTWGKRDDINDDLYRIAPLNGLFSLTHQREKWFASIEGLFYARQSKVSRTNNESKTSGYGILNIRGQVDLTEYFSISAGIENVLGKKYTDHLAGTNRVANSDVRV